MVVRHFDDNYGSNRFRVNAAIGVARRMLIVRFKYQAERMANINGVLLIAVLRQLVPSLRRPGRNLRQIGRTLQDGYSILYQAGYTRAVPPDERSLAEK